MKGAFKKTSLNKAKGAVLNCYLGKLNISNLRKASTSENNN